MIFRHAKLLIALFAVALLAGAARSYRPAQEQMPSREISGFIRTADGRPLSGATIMLQSVAGEVLQQISPEGNGRFNFPSLEGGIYYVEVTAQGYQPRRERADLISSRRITLQFTLMPQPQDARAEHPPNAVINQRLLRIPEPARKEFEKGQQLLNQKKPADSMACFKKAIEKHAEFPEAYLLLGTAHMDLQQWKDAKESVGKALELDPKLPGAHFAMGTTLAQLGEMPAAEKAFQAGLADEPQSIIGHWELARLYWTLKRIPEAEQHTRKTLELAPRLAQAHLLMGNVFIAKKDLPAALQEFKAYLAIEPEGALAEQAKQAIKGLEAALAKK